MPVGDLRMYSISSRTWTDLSNPSAGSPPSARFGHAMVASGDFLFVFGGSGEWCGWMGGERGVGLPSGGRERGCRGEGRGKGRGRGREQGMFTRTGGKCGGRGEGREKIGKVVM